MSKVNVSMTVNGKAVSAEVEPRTLLIHYLRENLSPHRSAYRLRHLPLRRLHRRSRRQVGEILHDIRGAGRGRRGAHHRGHGRRRTASCTCLQEAFREMHGLQCGYCTPGMIVRAHRLLQENPSPTEAEIRMGISGNLCRCTGYQNIVKAIQYAAAKINGVEYQGSRGMNAPTTPTSLERAEKLQGMGCKRKRVEDVRFTQGRGNYVDDIKLPGMLHGDFHRSSHAHARILKIDTSKAKAVPGVLAVLTAEDLKGVNLAWMPTLAGDVQMVLADGKVLFQNQEIAFVVATDRYIAADAADLVEVEYEALPVVVDPFKAMDADAPVLREDIKDKMEGAHGPRKHYNHIFNWQVGDRDLTDAAFLKAEVATKDLLSLSARASLPAGDLPVPGELHQDHRRDHDLRHLPGAACHPHGRGADLRPARAQNPRDLARHRRRLRQQGRRLSRLYLLGGRLDRHRPAGQMGRGPHRESLDDLVRPRLSHDHRNRGDEGRPRHGLARPYPRRPRRLRRLRRPVEMAGGLLQHRHRLL